MDRGLSGIYVRVQESDGKLVKFASKDLTDCTEEQIRAAMTTRAQWELRDWIVALCRQFKRMGDSLNVVSEFHQLTEGKKT